MTLQELLKKIGNIDERAEAKMQGASDGDGQVYLHGYRDALADIGKMVKDAREAERLRQRLARLENVAEQDPDVDWSRAPLGSGETSGGAVVSIDAGRGREAA